MCYNVLDVSRFVINYCNKENKLISNIKLQKILYYIQAAFLVEYNKKCFNESIVNWTYGPVVEEAYREFRIYGSDFIKTQFNYKKIIYNKKTNKIEFVQKEFNENIFNDKEKRLIQRIVDIYDNLDPFDLVEKTHKEKPWSETNQNDIISTKKIQEFYKQNKNLLYNCEC